jgi:hypothetical protein
LYTGLHDPRHHGLQMPTTIVLFLLCLLSAITVRADDFHRFKPLTEQQIAEIIPTSTRTVIDLSGAWQEMDEEEVKGTLAIPFTHHGNRTITLRRSVKMDKATLQSRSWQLYFLGVSDEVSLLVNGREVMRYPGGTAPFTASIPDQFLREGSNSLQITMHERGFLASLVSKFAPNAGKIRTGVLREVFLIGTPHVWTSEIQTATSFTSAYQSATIVATATVNGSNVDMLVGRAEGDEAMRQGSVDVVVEALLRSTTTGEVVARSVPVTTSIERRRSQKIRCDLNVSNPQLWTPQNPNLYKLEVQLSVGGRTIDSYSMNYGFRNLRVADVDQSRRILLNGRPVFLNAVEYAEEYPQTGPSLSWVQMEHDVSLLKTLGVNVVRFSHRVPHPYLLHLCDRYGLMALTEVEAAGIPSGMLLQEEISALMKNRADLLATFVGQHPSIIGCGLSDRLQEGRDETNVFHKLLTEQFRSKTPHLIYKTVSASQIGMTSEGGFDVVIVRIDDSWSRQHMTSVIETAKRVITRAAIVMTTGSLVSPNNSNGFSDPLSTESQALAIRRGYEAARSFDLAGIVVSTFNDYTLEFPTMLVDHSDPYIQTSGLVDHWRQPRVSYAMYKALINDEKEPLLQAREYDDATPLVFIATGLILALVLTFMVNRSRRFREYFLRSIVRPYNFYADIRDQRILSTAQTLLLGIVISAGAGLVLAAILYYLRFDTSVQYLMHILVPNAFANEIIRFVAWRPPMAVATFGTFVFLSILTTTILLRLGGIFVRGRILVRDTFTIVVWSAVPLLALLPIGIVLYQVMHADAVSFWIPLIVIAAVVWTLLRTLRATSVVFDVSPLIVYLIGVGLIVVVIGTFAALWAIRVEGFQFLQYYQSVISV